MNIVKCEINKKHNNDVLFQNGIRIIPPKAYWHLSREAIGAMRVKIVYKAANGSLITIELQDTGVAAYSIYNHHIWGMAMACRDSQGNDCLRYESQDAYGLCSQ